MKDCGHCDICEGKQDSVIDTKDIKKEILEAVLMMGQIRVPELVLRYHVSVKEQVLEYTRELIDDGILIVEHDYLMVKKK
jgi:hypothetical protein